MITVIIPTFNERKNISKIVKKIFNLKIKNLNILVVDDSSPDGTGLEVLKLKKKNKKIHLKTNKEKLGLGKAYMVGMEYAINKLKADILVEMDADLSHDPNILPKMLELIPKFDMILGSRYIQGGSIPSDWEFHRKFVSTIGNLIFRIFFSWKIKDWTTGYRVIKSEIYTKIKNELDEDMFKGYTFQVGFLYKAIKYGFKIKEYPLNFKDRKDGFSKFKGLNYIKNNLLFIIKTKLKG